jgi:Ran GTPase-activating protein (RanGAP) involved in mRNA processing and transport
MADAPYFDAKSFLRLGMSQHDVDALRVAFERTGGSSVVVLSLNEIEEIVEGALSALTIARNAMEAVTNLKREVEALERRVNLTKLTTRVDNLEALTA